MTDCRVVVVQGGSPEDRAAVTASVLSQVEGASLILTGHPDAVDPGLDTSEDGPVEVRPDDPAARLEAFVSGAADPQDDVLAALAAGGDTPLAAVLGWEYARRAANAGYWDVVVVELEGDLTAARRMAAAGELAAFVESRWPAHVRFASMSAGELAEVRVREAHRLALLADDVAGFLSGPVEIVPVSGGERALALAALARGAVAPELVSDGAGGYLASYPVPVPPTRPVAVTGERLDLSLDGLAVSLPLPSLLRRCVLDGAEFDEGAGRLHLRFLPDPELWPPNLVRSGSGDLTG